MSNLTNPLRYDCTDDVQMRLENTIVRYKGQPIRVSSAISEEPLWLKYMPLGSNKWQPNPIHSSDEELDISALPLGYMNDNANKNTWYVQRAPARKQKQGFCKEHAACWPESLHQTEQLPDPFKLLYTGCLARTVLNDFPSPQYALTLLLNNPNVHSIAWHRKFAFIKDDLGIIKLRHMMRSIGYFTNPLNLVCKLIPDYENEPLVEELSKHEIEVSTL